jgi:hypothetical protein
LILQGGGVVEYVGFHGIGCLSPEVARGMQEISGREP